jgi:hypothetical protein
MTTHQQHAEEWRRLTTAKSIAEVIAEDVYVDHLVQLDGDGIPEWLSRLEVPDGWRLAQLDDSSPARPTRVAVCGQRADTGWEASDTISVFGFTGVPLFRNVLGNAACILRDLDAHDITTRVLTAPPKPGVLAVRSSGTFTIARLCVWAQYSTYLAGSEQPAAGRLIMHNVFVESGYRTRLVDDIIELSDAVHQGFIAGIRCGR